MKVNFDIECTPEEARLFLGLPNVAPMQERIMKDMEDKVHESFNSMDPENLIKTWMPMTFQGWNEMQKMFWDHMVGAASGMTMPGATPKKDEKKTEK